VPGEFKLKDIGMLFILIKNARKNKIETAADPFSLSQTKKRDGVYN